MARLHIALLLHSPAGGGAQRRSLDLAAALAGAGFAITLVLIEDNSPLPLPAVEVVVLPSRLTRLPWVRTNRMRQAAAAIPALAEWLRHRHPDLLLAAANHVHLTAIAAHALAGRPGRLVLRVSNHLGGGRRRPLADWLKRRSVGLYQRADCLVAVSADIADHLSLLAPGARVEMLPNPVVDASFPSRMAAPCPHPWLVEERPVVLGCGRLEPQKDFPTLIRAAARLGARAIILGEGSRRDELTQLARRLGVELALPGFVDPLPWLARGDAFALSSAWEGLPGALIEALACGCPCVATCIPGAVEVLGNLGPLVPVGDAAALAEALAGVIATPPARDPLRARAAGWSVTAGAAAYGALLTALCAERPATTAAPTETRQPMPPFRRR
jgi:glycosyltransferase involved in cell wall biosynthesis